MNFLSPLFLWLLPLALLPVIIHLLNRLRYQTVKWAAMMFLRSADRDASRRAKIRQWLILAARCLMLLMFLLALSRIQSKGRLARFFDPGSNLVIVLFDRSASMEHLRGGVSGRERALSLLNQGLSELGPGARVLWMDSATGELTPLPNAIDLERLPMVEATETSVDLSAMLRSALQEIARAGVTKAEVWIPTDRQSSAWLPDGANPPDWSEWTGMNTQITLRLLDVAEVGPDPGNRALQLVEQPSWDGEDLTLQLRLLRDTAAPESVPLRIDFGGLSLQEDIMVEGERFLWEQTLPVATNQSEVHAQFSLPADSNPADNRVAVSWVDRGALKASVDSGDPEIDTVFRAAVLPYPGLRELVEADRVPGPEIHFQIKQSSQTLSSEDSAWIEQGGVLLLYPSLTELNPVGVAEEGVGIHTWDEQSGVLATEQREPLRMDLVRIYEAVTLSTDGEDLQVLATMDEGGAFLTRQRLGEGVLYRLATVPLRNSSNLDAGYVLVPMLQRMLMEGAVGSAFQGTHVLGEVELGALSDWQSLGNADASPLFHVGRYQGDEGVLALNRLEAEDRSEQLSVTELQEWAGPLELRVFEDRSNVDSEINSRFEFTGLLALSGLVFLLIESWLLTRNIRRPAQNSSAWSASA